MAARQAVWGSSGRLTPAGCASNPGRFVSTLVALTCDPSLSRQPRGHRQLHCISLSRSDRL